MYLWKWYDKGLIGRWNVRNSEGKGGWKYDISESQHSRNKLWRVDAHPFSGGAPFSGGFEIYIDWEGSWRFGHLGCSYHHPIYQLAYFLGWLDTFGRRAKLLRVSSLYWSMAFFSWRVWHSDLLVLIFISYSTFGGIFFISGRIL